VGGRALKLWELLLKEGRLAWSASFENTPPRPVLETRAPGCSKLARGAVPDSIGWVSSAGQERAGGDPVLAVSAMTIEVAEGAFW
jgi:hypothetical protein